MLVPLVGFIAVSVACGDEHTLVLATPVLRVRQSQVLRALFSHAFPRHSRAFPYKVLRAPPCQVLSLPMYSVLSLAKYSVLTNSMFSVLTISSSPCSPIRHFATHQSTLLTNHRKSALTNHRNPLLFSTVVLSFLINLSPSHSKQVNTRVLWATTHTPGPSSFFAWGQNNGGQLGLGHRLVMRAYSVRIALCSPILPLCLPILPLCSYILPQCLHIFAYLSYMKIRAVPTAIEALAGVDIIYIAAGARHSLALTSFG